ncbi:MAG: FIST C-terminal domain-containing protein [Sedimentisphaerales bacterium]|nr:FIST C-terminal domain-containing protein [Sedimentisphaerales bacterium]
MKTTQKQWIENTGWRSISSNGIAEKAQAVFLFGERKLLIDNERINEVRKFYPNAHIIGCSTAGEIAGSSVYDDSMIATAVFFEDTPLMFSQTNITNMADTYQAGQQLAEGLKKDGLVHVFVLSNGLNINGSALSKGLRSKLPEGVSVTGGLAGDQARFEETLVILDENCGKHTVAAIGLYGNAIKIGYGSQGGRDTFGPDRLITRSKDNVLFELDNQPALELYKTYLGDQADGLPATGLLFPLSLSLDGSNERLVRTILAVDEKDGSMTFAGDIPQGCNARLMKANFDRLAEGAAVSARDSQVTGSVKPDLAILISCVGRKLVLKQRIDEEVENVQNVLGSQAALTGFYSYGEICPVEPQNKQAELHNQTMTITTFCEE